MTVLDELDAIRTRAAYTRSKQTAMLALRGDDAREALLHLFPSRLFLRDAQVKESVLLTPDGRPIADALVCADDEDYLLLVEGPSAAELLKHIETHLPANTRTAVEDLAETYELMSLHGPWAWQLAAAVLGADLVALPYLNFFRLDPGLAVRAGKTGEYGYDLLIRHELADEVWAKIVQEGAPLEASEVAAAALSLARFENWFFDPAHVPDGVTPLELQLSWRLDRSRAWVGREAIDARLADGVKRSLTCILTDAEVAIDDAVRFADKVIGEVVRVEHSAARDAWVVAALLDVDFAHGGIDRYRIGEASVASRTVAPPLIDNQSLYVDPRRHTWEARDEVTFGPDARRSG